VEQQQLSTVSCTTATFSRYRQDAYHATIDYVFVSKHPVETELQYASTNVTSPDPSHDHKIQKVTLLDLPVSGLPTLREMIRPKRIKKDQWTDKRDQWAAQLQHQLQSVHDVDPYLALDAAIKHTVSVSEQVLGTSGGSQVIKVKTLSQEERKLLCKLKLLRTARNNIHEKRVTGGRPTMAVVKLWDQRHTMGFSCAPAI
jgi:hypothetical protein